MQVWYKVLRVGRRSIRIVVMTSNQHSMRVAFLTNFVPHYRKTFYEKLCGGSAYEWMLVRSAQGEPGRDAYEGKIAVPGALVKGSSWRLGSFTIRWQHGAFRLISHFNPDLLILLGITGTLSNWILLLWSKAAGKKVIVWACGWDPQQPGSVASRLKRLLSRIYFRLPDRLLLYSSKGASYLEGHGVSRKKMRICYNGLDIDGLEEQQEAIRRCARVLRSETVPNSAKLILYVGALVADKRVDDLLYAFSKIDQNRDPSHLWIVGSGPNRDRLEQVSRELRLKNVRFLGRIGDEIESYFAAADFFVLPGHGGLAFNQAMYWGTPCVVSEADGTEDDLVIDGETGFRFQLGNRDSLFTALNACLRLPAADRGRMSQAARRLIVNRSNVNEMVAEFNRSIEELLAHPSPVSPRTKRSESEGRA
jgi:glycosyltransferase involved in cell wall biosynthesis